MLTAYLLVFHIHCVFIILCPPSLELGFPMLTHVYSFATMEFREIPAHGLHFLCVFISHGTRDLIVDDD